MARWPSRVVGAGGGVRIWQRRKAEERAMLGVFPSSLPAFSTRPLQYGSRSRSELYIIVTEAVRGRVIFRLVRLHCLPKRCHAHHVPLSRYHGPRVCARSWRKVLRDSKTGRPPLFFFLLLPSELGTSGLQLMQRTLG